MHRAESDSTGISDSDESARMHRLRQLATLDHPALPTLYCLWAADGDVWAAVEKIEAERIVDSFARGVQWRFAQVREWIRHALEVYRELSKVGIDPNLLELEHFHVSEAGQLRFSTLFGMDRAPPATETSSPRHVPIACRALDDLCSLALHSRLRIDRRMFGRDRRLLRKLRDFLRDEFAQRWPQNDDGWITALARFDALRFGPSERTQGWAALFSLSSALALGAVWADDVAHRSCDDATIQWPRIYSEQVRDALLGRPAALRDLALIPLLDHFNRLFSRPGAEACDESLVGTETTPGIRATIRCLGEKLPQIQSSIALAKKGHDQQALSALRTLGESCGVDPGVAQSNPSDLPDLAALEFESGYRLRTNGSKRAATSKQVHAELLAAASDMNKLRAQALAEEAGSLDVMTNRVADWVEVWRSTVATLQRQDPEVAGWPTEIELKLGLAAAHFGDRITSRKHLDRVQESLDNAGSRVQETDAAAILFDLSAIYFSWGEVQSARRQIANSLALLSQQADIDAARMRATRLRHAYITGFSGDLARALNDVDRYRANASGPQHREFIGHQLAPMIDLYLLAGRCGSAQEVFALARETMQDEAGGDVSVRLNVLAQELKIARRCGSTPDRATLDEFTHRLAAPMDWTHENAQPRLHWQLYRAHQAERMVDVDPAQVVAQALQEIEDLLASNVENRTLVEFERAMLIARLAYLRGDFDRAIDELSNNVLRVQSLFGERSILIVDILELRAELLRQRGNTEKARRDATLAISLIAEELGEGCSRGARLLAWLAHLELESGTTRQARHYFSQARNAADERETSTRLLGFLDQASQTPDQEMKKLVASCPRTSLFPPLRAATATR
jgi:tetratricopeptide (TPR) repeat protein